MTKQENYRSVDYMKNVLLCEYILRIYYWIMHVSKQIEKVQRSDSMDNTKR